MWLLNLFVPHQTGGFRIPISTSTSSTLSAVSSPAAAGPASHVRFVVLFQTGLAGAKRGAMVRASYLLQDKAHVARIRFNVRFGDARSKNSGSEIGI